MAVGTCQICGKEFEGPPSRIRDRKYCSHSCAAKGQAADRARTAEELQHAGEIAETAIGQEVARQVAPVVAEALTEEILEQVRALVGLVPEAVATLGQLLKNEDPAEQRQAANAILRYTLGNSNVAPENSDGPIQINFGMPMQGEVVDAEGSVLEVIGDETVEEARACMDCGETKPADEFVGQSSRCQLCHDTMLNEIRERFPGMVP